MFKNLLTVISIRKIMGAGIRQIVPLLLKAAIANPSRSLRSE